MADNQKYTWGTGRRKTSVARVRVREGEGKFIVNGKPMEVFFNALTQREMVLWPLVATNCVGKYDILVNTNGGGISGQAGAIVLGIARALCELNPLFDEKLRSHGYLTRDSRMKERKKYGRKSARARFQFSKR